MATSGCGGASSPTQCVASSSTTKTTAGHTSSPGHRRPPPLAPLAPRSTASSALSRGRRDMATTTAWYEVLDHCNGLVVFWDTSDDAMYVCNPTTQRWTRLPPWLDEPSWDHRRAFLVFDPAVSPHYKVLLAPMEPRKESGAEVNDEGDARRFMEWQPSPWTWQEFSSRTGRWEKKVFVREGEAAGTVGDLLFVSLAYGRVEPRWRYAAYWQGELYVHCHGEYVSSTE
nr:unnamed protein product [Digitaria exilis]